MSKYSYRKTKTRSLKKLLRICSLIILIIGLSLSIYVLFPLFLWQVYFSPVFASGELLVPIPKTTIATSSNLKSLLASASDNLRGVDYSNPQNWFPSFAPSEKSSPRVSSYTISIPKLNIKDAEVSTVDNLLDNHLVNYQGTGIPPDKGNAVIYGHSTLPQLFNQKDYKTIFATLHTIKVGDEIFVDSDNMIYKYAIFEISIVSPDDTSIFTQHYDESYITLVTCTPPGTTWKRLIVKARLEKI